MLVLVTGATGFIGRHLVHALLTSGYTVRALVRETSDCAGLRGCGVDIIRNGHSTDFCANNTCAGVDVAINLAGKMGGPSVAEEEMRAINVSAVRAIAEACQQAGVKQFIHCSTPGVVGMVGVAPECMPYRPSGPYERTKCEGERVALSYHKHGLIPVTVIRPDFVYGPGDTHKLKLFQAIKEGRFPIIGGGASLLHPTYVDDIIAGIMLTISNPIAYGEIFNLAGPRPVTVSELASEIADALHMPAPKLRVPLFAAQLAAAGAELTGKVLSREPRFTRYQVNFFARNHASDISKAQQMLGYQPKTDLRDGVARTVAWYKERGLL